MNVTKVDVRTHGPKVKTRIHFFPENESVFANLINRFTRPHEEYRKVLDQVIDKIEEPDLAKSLKESKLNWSQRAGCSCGCSPGFIADRSMGYTIFVDVSS